jgi:hypothetical protein
MERADIEKAIRQLRGSGSTGRKKPVQPVIEARAQPTKPPVERMLAKMAANAEAEVMAAEEVEAAEVCCSFCGETGLDLVRNASHTVCICWDCAVEAAALLAPPPLPPEVHAIGDAMLAHRTPEEPPKPEKEARAPARQQGDGFGDGAEQHNGGGARQ